MNNEELDSQLSAMFDDELPEQQCELLARRLARDENLKATWGRYAAIGAVIRKEHRIHSTSNLAGKVSAAIASEPSLVSEPAGVRKKFTSPAVRRWIQPVAGAALAASVAALAILFMRAQAPLGQPVDADAQLLTQNTSEVTAVPSSYNSEPDSYTVPQAVEPLSVVPSAELANYVVAHSEVSPPFTRRNLLSAFVASDQGTVGASGESEPLESEDRIEDGTHHAEQAR